MATAGQLLNDAIEAMEELHASMTPDESCEEMNAIIPASSVRRFVDTHARLLYERGQLIAAGKY